MEDSRAEVAPVVAAFADALAGRVAGLYIAGSMATGDYRPRISDIDAVALVDAPLRPPERAELVALHRRLIEQHESGRALHCVYIPRLQVRELARKHWTWGFGELFRRPLSGIARAELLVDPIVAFGPRPTSWLPAMDASALRAAACAELSGYWSRAVRKRAIWSEDVYVDLGLTVWARAAATIDDGALITKSEAIERMRSRLLPAAVVDGVAARRAGDRTELSDDARAERATVVRTFLVHEIARLTRPAQPR